MKNMIIVCSAVSFLGAIIKMIFISMNKEKYTYAVNTVIGFIILITIVNYFKGNEFKIPEFYAFTDTDYSAINGKYMDEILNSSEKEVEEKICREINYEFNITPYKCDISINKDDLTVENAEIVFKQTDGLISNYEISSFIEKELGIKAEVKFI